MNSTTSKSKIIVRSNEIASEQAQVEKSGMTSTSTAKIPNDHVDEKQKRLDQSELIFQQLSIRYKIV